MQTWDHEIESQSLQSRSAPAASDIVAIVLGFVAALYVAWTGAWLLPPVFEGRLGWPATADERTLYWTMMEVLIWVAPSLFVFRYAGLSVRKAMKGNGVGPTLAWGVGAGLLIGAEAMVRKWVLAQPYSLTFSWPLVSIVFIVPFVEELVFRGVVLGGLMRRYRFAVANVISSLLFVGAHVPGWYFSGVLSERLSQPIGGAASIFLLGLIFGLVVRQSRSLAAATIAHGLNNFFSVL